MTTIAAPEDDVIEFDEVCVRKSPSFWLCLHARMKWTAISRKTGQVLGFSIGDRTREMLEAAWSQTRQAVLSDVPQDYRDKPVKTDHLAAYAPFFPSEQHEACDKGSGKTSLVEAWNTKWRQWRQRQSGLVRPSCGVGHRIIDDIDERYLILVEQHNLLCRKKCLACQGLP